MAKGSDRLTTRRQEGPRQQTARDRRRRSAWLVALAVLIVAATTAAGWRGDGRPGGAASWTGSAVGRTSAMAPTRSQPAATPNAAPPTAATPTASPPLGSGARQSCPPAASACVDLDAHLTWLQSDGFITYGPVRMEPGPPGTSHATPRGTFHVLWKAGAHFMSSQYHEPMPYAVFFAPGGIAFHGGPLDTASHGCVHLDIDSAQYYNYHLPVGAEVVVF